MNEPFKLYVKTSKIGEGQDPVWSYVLKLTDYFELTGMDGVMVQYTGLSPNAAMTYKTDLAGQNGSKFQSARLGTRNIVLTFTIFKDIETNRRIIQKVLAPSKRITLYYIGTRQVFVDGVVETMNLNQFASTPHKQVIQCSILCSDPLLKALDTVTVKWTSPAGSHDLYYGGEYSYGMHIKMTFSGSVTNPGLRNDTDGEDFTGNWTGVGETFAAGDVLDISTFQGQHYITKTVTSGGTTSVYDLTNQIRFPIGWVQVTSGYNDMAVIASSNSANIATVEITMREVYGGV